MQPWGPALLLGHEGHGDTHFPFSFPGLQSHQPLPLRAPIHLPEYPHKTPLPTTSSWLLDAHTLSLALITKVTALWPRLASDYPRDGAVPLCSHTPTVQTQSPYPRLLETGSQLWKDLPFPPPTSVRKCTSQNRCQPSKV